MYPGLPKGYKRKFTEFLQNRKHWVGLVLYDQKIIAFALSKESGKGKMRIASLKSDISRGIKGGRIINSRKAGDVIKNLVQSVSEETCIKDNRLIIGLDVPLLRLTPKQWADNTCLKGSCDKTVYKRILYNIIREATFDSQYIIEIIPFRIAMDERWVEDPYGLTGQMNMDNMLVSLSYEDQKDFVECLKKIGYRCEVFFSGFLNLCTAFSDIAIEKEQIVLMDMKFSSTDLILFEGDQPLAMKCYQQGLDNIIIESLSALLNTCRKDTVGFLAKYIKNYRDKDAQIIGKNELPAYSIGLKCWEIDEIVTGQLIDFISMEDGINELLLKWQSELHAMPRKLIITGVGSRLPEIVQLLENKINVKCEIRHWAFPGINGQTPATVYGMVRSIARDSGVRF